MTGLCVALLGCASIQNAPVNLPGSSADLADKVRLNYDVGAEQDADLIGLSFSGGGTRAAAFSFGVLTEMQRTPVRGARGSMKVGRHAGRRTSPVVGIPYEVQ